MSLASGSRLGPYEIVGLLGAGGMGEVYCARDSKLQRDVAIKVLPEAFALDADRLARFQREAQVLASLNHPNIATIHSFDEADGVRALVMELVDGPTLADRIAEGPIPLDESLHMARQIVDALDAAHERGIIHRDLKPANIKLRPDGTVKVLDFGLAKAMEPPSASVAAVTLSPTITTPAMTGAGVILGTAAYMSPEQAKGRVADKRSDVWAFGCVLYEMLSGRRPFEGEDVSDTFAFILTKDPEWAALPPATPVPIRRLLRRCLEKHQRRRLADIADARLDLEEATSTSAVDGPTIAGIGTMRGGMALRRAVAWTIVAAASAAAVTFVVLWAASPVAPPLATHRLLVELGADVSLLAEPGGAIALSNDGDVLAFVAQATPTAPSQLYVRRLEDLQAKALAGTEGAFAPFFSPDGEWIAFFAAGKLKKVAVSGGTVLTLSDVMSARGGSWAEDGTITFTPDTAPGLSLLRVSAAGGQPAPLGMLLDGEVTQRWPQSLLGRDAVLYTSHNDGRNFDAANLVVRSQRSMETKIVLRGGYSGRYVSSGHLVYIREGTLLAAPFDIERLETTGPSVPAVEGVAAIPRAGGAHFSISDAGTLVYVPGQSASGQLISWMDRAGKMSILGQAAEAWANPQFSPDGRSLALQIGSDRPDVWVYDLARETFSRLTLDPEVDLKPVWTPDSQRITFSSQRAGMLRSNLYWQRTDSTEAQRLTTSPNNQMPGSWHPTSRWLAFSEVVMGRADLMILPLEGDAAQLRPGTPTPFSRTSFNEIEPMFSPDGRWLAYASDESGHFEVYVRPFPSAAGKETISTGGGSFPTWSRTRPELFYRSNDGRLMVSSYAVEGETFRAQKPRPVADTLVVSQGGARRYDLHPDGNRFAIASVLDEGSTKRHQVVVVVNFFEHLRLIAPVR